jgi:hypothetical protein
MLDIPRAIAGDASPSSRTRHVPLVGPTTLSPTYISPSSSSTRAPLTNPLPAPALPMILPTPRLALPTILPPPPSPGCCRSVAAYLDKGRRYTGPEARPPGTVSRCCRCSSLIATPPPHYLLAVAAEGPRATSTARESICHRLPHIALLEGSAPIEVSSPASIDAASTLAPTAICEPITDATCTDRAWTPHHLFVAATMGTPMVLPLEVANSPIDGRLCSCWWSPMLPPTNIDVARTSPEKCIATIIQIYCYNYFPIFLL